MPENEMEHHPSHHDDDLYLVEIGEGAGRHYLICQRIIKIDPSRSAMGIPYQDLDRMLTNHPLRATPLPGMQLLGGGRGGGGGGVSTGPGVSTESGASTRIDINLNR